MTVHLYGNLLYIINAHKLLSVSDIEIQNFCNINTCNDQIKCTTYRPSFSCWHTQYFIFFKVFFGNVYINNDDFLCKRNLFEIQN